jgi:hypothetical protein
MDLLEWPTDPELDEDAVTLAHLILENELIDLRDRRVGILGRGNGLVVNEKDSTPSSIIRITTDEAIRVAVRAYNRAVEHGTRGTYHLTCVDCQGTRTFTMLELANHLAELHRTDYPTHTVTVSPADTSTSV